MAFTFQQRITKQDREDALMGEYSRISPVRCAEFFAAQSNYLFEKTLLQIFHAS